MKDRINQIQATIKSKLAEAEKLLDANELEKVETLHNEIASLRKQAGVLKSQLEVAAAVAHDEQQAELKTLKERMADLEKAAKEPVRPPFSTGEDPDEGVTSRLPPVYKIRYGDTDVAVEAVAKDLYGKDYNQRREEQMKAFARYIRLGERGLTTKEMNLLVPGGNIILRPERIVDEIKAGRSVAEIKATLEEATLDLGGVLVPEDYRTEIIKRLMGVTVVRARARIVQTIRDAIEWPELDGGNSRYTSAVRVTWVEETPASATTAATNPTFAMRRIPVNTVMARTDLSRNLLEDSAVNLLDIVADLFAEAMAIDEDEQFLIGTGGGRPKGVLGERTSGTSESPVTGVTTVVSGDATQLTADGLVNLVYGLASQYRRNAVLIGRTNTHRDIRKIKDGNGDYMWEKGLRAGEPLTLLGNSMLESEAMPAIGANIYPLIFGDWRGYVIVDRVGMTMERVADTTTVGTNTVALFARRRLGGQVIEPWRFVVQQVSA